MHKKNRHFMRGRLINYIDLFVTVRYFIGDECYRGTAAWLFPM